MVPRPTDPPSLFGAAVGGDRVALAKILSTVERGGPGAREVVGLAYRTAPDEADGYTVGITGAPGAGKSTLTDRLVALVRTSGRPAQGPDGAASPDDAGDLAGAASPNGAGDLAGAASPNGAGDLAGAASPDGAGDLEVAVLAVDPSSPFTGGAILGDRVRMQGHALDRGVFIRSMATRGHLGGLAVAVPDAIRVLHACGVGLVLIETVGVGQVEVEVASAADTTVVVVNPGWGDAIQANKAGLLEIADVFAINKADRPGARETRRDLELMLDLTAGDGWRPPIVETVAASGEGTEALWTAVGDHRRFLTASGQLGVLRRRRLEIELHRIAMASVEVRFDQLVGQAVYGALVDRVVSGELDPYEAADQLLGAFVVPTA